VSTREVDAASTTDYLALEAEASAPYAAFVYRDRAEAAAIQRLLFDKGAGEFAARFGQVSIDEDGVAGMFASLPGAELATVRMKAAWAVAKAGLVPPQSTTAARTTLAAATLIKPRPTDHYLSRIAVSAAHRGRGVGGSLLRAAIARARAAGADRLVLEVSPTHGAAAGMYARHGFAVEDERTVTHEDRSLTYRHMALGLRDAH
jgi:ribosomal protein S18 acetylase RimI-like enzyme